MESDIEEMRAINVKMLLSDRRVDRDSLEVKKKQSVIGRGRN